LVSVGRLITYDQYHVKENFRHLNIRDLASLFFHTLFSTLVTRVYLDFFAINRSLQAIKFRGSLRDRLSANVTNVKTPRTPPPSKVSKANEYSLVSERIILATVNRRASVYFRSRFTTEYTFVTLSFLSVESAAGCVVGFRGSARETGPRPCRDNSKPGWYACVLESNSGIARVRLLAPEEVSTAAHAEAYQGRAEPTPPSTPRWSRASLGGSGALIPDEFPASGSIRIYPIHTSPYASNLDYLIILNLCFF